MNVWKNGNWKNIVDSKSKYYRNGLRLHFQKGVDLEVKRSCVEFAKWLRKQYYFPLRVPIYFKTSKYIKCQDGDMVSAKIFMPFDKSLEPYITIATGDITEIKLKKGQDDALAGVLGSMVHELTHYFQWLNDLNISENQAERQANYYRNKIVDEYALTREHP